MRFKTKQVIFESEGVNGPNCPFHSLSDPFTDRNDAVCLSGYPKENLQKTMIEIT